MSADQTCSSCAAETPTWAQAALDHEVQGRGGGEVELLGWSLVDAGGQGRVGHIVYRHCTKAWTTKGGVSVPAQDNIRFYTFALDTEDQRTSGMGGLI